MRIKLFETYSESDYFFEIQESEARDYFFKKKTSESEQDNLLKKLRKLLPEYKFSFKDDREARYDYISKSVYLQKSLVKIHKYYNLWWQEFYILSLPDEWYLVIYEQWYYRYDYREPLEYYKCDQWEGVEKFLKRWSVI